MIIKPIPHLTLTHTYTHTHTCIYYIYIINECALIAIVLSSYHIEDVYSESCSPFCGLLLATLIS